MYENVVSDELVGRIILIPPLFWGSDTIENEYWKNIETYHKSMQQLSKDDMENNIYIVGKIIQKVGKSYYDALLLCDSNINSLCKFNTTKTKEFLLVSLNKKKKGGYKRRITKKYK